MRVWRSVHCRDRGHGRGGVPVGLRPRLSRLWRPRLIQRAARVDPAVAAREVLQDQDFWWKRIEQRSMTIPTTGIQAFFAWLLDLPLQILRWAFLAIRDFINWLRRNVFELVHRRFVRRLRSWSS